MKITDDKPEKRECPWYLIIAYPNLKTIAFFISKEKNLISSKIQSLTASDDVQILNGSGNAPRLELLWIKAGANRGPTLKNLRESFAPKILPSVNKFYVRKLPRDKNQLELF